MRLLICCLISLLPLTSYANIGPDGFHDYQRRVFVETGTFLGTGIRKALEAGFEEIHSIEINPVAASLAKKQFSDNPHIHIYEGDSGEMLSDVLQNIHEPVTFWLDAHGKPESSGGKHTPVLKELEQIAEHPIKEHIILIDDLQCCDTILFDHISLAELIAKVLEVNPDYSIWMIDGGDDGEYPCNILVALPPVDKPDCEL